jgi:hypothetical protein
MTLDASPKKFAEDVAEGLQIVSRPMLKKYTPADIAKILGGLDIVAREIRSVAVEAGDYEGLKVKGMKMQRINSASLVIRTFMKDQKRMGGEGTPPLSSR